MHVASPPGARPRRGGELDSDYRARRGPWVGSPASQMNGSFCMEVPVCVSYCVEPNPWAQAHGFGTSNILYPETSRFFIMPDFMRCSASHIYFFCLGVVVWPHGGL